MDHDDRLDRRTSPSAPQGAVVVAGALVVLLAVIGLLAGSFASAGGQGSAPTTTSAGSLGPAEQAASPEPNGVAPTTRVAPVRHGSTTMFVTTTQWVTTTSSTTTTTPGDGHLNVRGGPLQLDPGDSANLWVSNTGDARLRWAVASSSTDVTVQPVSGALEPAETVSVTVKAKPGAGSGSQTLTFFSDGGVTKVKVVVGAPEPTAPLTVTVAPSAPTCASAVAVRIEAAEGVDAVAASYSVDSTTSTPLALLNVGSQRWSATIPPQAAGSEVRVRVSAEDAGGDEVSKSVYYTVRPGFGGAC